MADFFGAIAAGEIGSKRLPLIFPEPTPKNGIRFPLQYHTGETPIPVYKKPDSRAELDLQIDSLREHYTPFMQKLAPKPQSTRTIFLLKDFQMREQTQEDLFDFSHVLRGDGEWENIKIPHYSGPTGNAVRYYRTSFFLKKQSSDKAVFLHFDGVDYIAEIFLNGSLLGTHEGFFGDFEFDCTPYLRDGENTLVVTVRNDYVYGGNQGPTTEACRLEGDKMYAATGYGYDDSETGWHHCPPGFGICEGVRVEVRERAFISDVFVRPLIESSAFEVWCEIFNCDYSPLPNVKLSYSVYGRNFEETVTEHYEYEPVTLSNADRGDMISVSDLTDDTKKKDIIKLVFHKGENLVKLRFPMNNPRLWNPDTPYLYEAQISLFTNGTLRDTATCPFGMRSFTQDTVSEKKGMFYLNGSSIRLRGANTMGFEQQDVLRGDFDMLLYDMLMAKACNMNFLRLTQRPVQKEIYSLCDEIGLMLQTDLPLFTVMRRTKFAEGIRQSEEMEKRIRSHPSSILITYMNEPMANGGNRPHRHLVREETDAFYNACDSAVRLLNPDRVIKHIDGDYDPPDSTLPDNHCYCTWYNGHGIDMGKLHRGYWLGVKDGWYYGCGEFGAEGLDPAPLMRARYPKEWLPETAEDEKHWTPARIKDSQSGNMHYFYYDTQETLEDWVRESHIHQSFGTKLQTEAFRRDPNMVSIAIHLFIDAWPSGWMKTIVDCERNPKSAFFTYQDALTPLMINIRSDRKTYFSDETVKTELFICNDTHIISNGHKIRLELLKTDGSLALSGEYDAKFGENSSFMQGEVIFTAPKTDGREAYTLRAILLDPCGNVIHYCDESMEFFRQEKLASPSAIWINAPISEKETEELLDLAKNGETVIISGLRPGQYQFGDIQVKVKACGMRPLHFVSRKTGHPLVEGYTPYDFRLWYNEEADMITPLIRFTFTAEGANPILTSGNSLRGSAWGQPLHPALACAEFEIGKGKLIINEVDLDSHLSNPIARSFRNRLVQYK